MIILFKSSDLIHVHIMAGFAESGYKESPPHLISDNENGL